MAAAARKREREREGTKKEEEIEICVRKKRITKRKRAESTSLLQLFGDDTLVELEDLRTEGRKKRTEGMKGRKGRKGSERKEDLLGLWLRLRLRLLRRGLVAMATKEGNIRTIGTE